MHDDKYCYSNSNVLKNKFGIKTSRELTLAEVKFTSARLSYLQNNPIEGNFDFEHLKEIHRYIFQDLYEWAGQERTVEIGKGNMFCITSYLNEYAESIFQKYYPQCKNNKDNFDDFIYALAENYGDLNAMHPFREGNGRAQREFARTLCLKCGYSFDLYCSTHQEMLNASILSFNKGDNSGFRAIFSKAIVPLSKYTVSDRLNILTSDDLDIANTSDYYYYYNSDSKTQKAFKGLYKAKIDKMNAEKEIDKAKALIKKQHSQTNANDLYR